MPLALRASAACPHPHQPRPDQVFDLLLLTLESLDIVMKGAFGVGSTYLNLSMIAAKVSSSG